jgi:hypothetical protein
MALPGRLIGGEKAASRCEQHSREKCGKKCPGHHVVVAAFNARYYGSSNILEPPGEVA